MYIEAVVVVVVVVAVVVATAVSQEFLPISQDVLVFPNSMAMHEMIKSIPVFSLERPP